ncbi:hypothetical protein LTR09_011998 [Extremus antarcticus]|uniref:NAD(P)-binding protein n=1 Tax=Extremus antarcticus TaxID=702011 RepID=A0AAJ0G7F0_9PEZI|nr:hypothetical protein LTR09_011998 [Extremus antarcticus]
MSQFAAKSTLPTQYDIYPFIEPSRFIGKLKGTVAVVTGAGRGIGRAAALAFASSGASVACVARRHDDLEAVVAEIKQKHGSAAMAVVADISAPDSPKRIIEDVEKILGPIDILLNCAGMTRFGTLVAEPDFNTWWRLLEVNLRGPVALIHAVLPSMIARKTGVVMTVTSTSGSQDIPFNTAYATSKAAVIKFHQDLSVEIERHGILSFSVHPGTVATDLGQVSSAINMDSVKEEPGMQEMLEAFQNLKYQTTELAANSFVALCADERCKTMNGRYIDSEQDLGEVIKEAEKGGKGRVIIERLYHLKVDEL